MKVSKQTAVRAFSILAAWLLTVALTLSAGLLIVRLTLCSPSFLKRQIADSGYAAAARQELADNYLSYGAAGGFRAEVMEGLLDGLDLEEDMRRAADSLYGAQTLETGGAALEDRFYEKLMAEVEAQHIRPTDEIRTGVRTLAQACSSDYQQRASIPFLEYLQPLIALVRKVTLWALAGLLAGAAVCVWLIFGLHRNRRVGLAYLSQSLIACAVLLCAAPLVLHRLIPIETLNLQPASLKLLLVFYVTRLFNSIWPFAAAVAVTAAAGCALYWWTGRRN